MTTRGMTPPAPLRNVLKTPGTRESTLMAEGRNYSTLDRESLRMHAAGRPGKIEVVPTKPLTTQYHLALAYSPGVAAPCLEIADDPSKAYDYPAKGNLVAGISNGTRVERQSAREG